MRQDLHAARMARADTVIVCSLPLAKNALHSPTSNLFITHLIVKLLYNTIGQLSGSVVSFNKPETLSSKVSCKYAISKV